MVLRYCLLSLLITTFYISRCDGQSSGSKIPRELRDCYGNISLYDRTLRIPSSITAFTSLLRRVENIPGLNMDMRRLSATLIHGFRIDGLERDPEITAMPGVIPFVPKGFQSGRYRLLVEKLLPGNAVNFPNASLVSEERCALHFMLSNSVDKWERGDEGSVCSRLQNYRSYRAPREAEDYAAENEQDLPEGALARQSAWREESDCPIEEGVIWTPWGTVNAGALLAGIATGLQRQEVSINQMNLGLTGPRAAVETGPVSNLYAATFSGDLGEVALHQGPKYQGSVTVGLRGGWNDTSMPRHYFLSTNQKYELSDAEMRGCLDGLILGKAIPDLLNAAGGRLSLAQVLEMYYSERGFPTNRKLRACQRKDHLANVASSEELTTQTRNIIPALEAYTSGSAVVEEAFMEQYIANSVNALLSAVPQLNDASCVLQNEKLTSSDQLSTPATDLTLVIDPFWMYSDALPTLSAILRDIAPHPAGSSITLYIGSSNEVPLLNYTRTILDFYGNFTEQVYRQYGSSPLEVTRSLSSLRGVYANIREQEKLGNRAGGRSQTLLFIAHTAMGATDDQSKKFMRNEARIFREANPDVRILVLSSGNKERFRDIVLDPQRDLFLLQTTSGYTVPPDVKDVVKRISELHTRFTNPECGSRWKDNDDDDDNGGGQQMQFFADPLGITYYKLLPNYFFNSEKVRVRFQATGQGRLIVCFSRTNEQPKSVGDPGQSGSNEGGNVCRQLTGSDSTEFRVDWPCDGVDYAVNCKPLYFSVIAADSTNRCTSLTTGPNAEDGCRFPDLVRFTVTATGLGCYSSASLHTSLSICLLVGIALFKSLLS